MIAYLSALALLLIGIYCVAVKSNLVKIVIGLIIMEYAVNLFLASERFPQGKMLVSVASLAGLATTILAVAIVSRIYDRFGTTDIKKIRRLKG